MSLLLPSGYDLVPVIQSPSVPLSLTNNVPRLWSSLLYVQINWFYLFCISTYVSTQHFPPVSSLFYLAYDLCSIMVVVDVQISFFLWLVLFHYVYYIFSFHPSMCLISYFGYCERHYNKIIVSCRASIKWENCITT